jgi:hypothetical protein
VSSLGREHRAHHTAASSDGRHFISTSTEARLVAQSSALWHIAHALCWSSDGTRGSSRLSCTKLHPTSSAWRDACDGQPAEQEVDRRELDQRLARLDLAQVILGQSAVCRKPSETPLYNPAEPSSGRALALRSWRRRSWSACTWAPRSFTACARLIHAGASTTAPAPPLLKGRAIGLHGIGGE